MGYLMASMGFSWDILVLVGVLHSSVSYRASSSRRLSSTASRLVTLKFLPAPLLPFRADFYQQVSRAARKILARAFSGKLVELYFAVASPPAAFHALKPPAMDRTFL